MKTGFLERGVFFIRERGRGQSHRLLLSKGLFLLLLIEKPLHMEIEIPDVIALLSEAVHGGSPEMAGTPGTIGSETYVMSETSGTLEMCET